MGPQRTYFAADERRLSLVLVWRLVLFALLATTMLMAAAPAGAQEETGVITTRATASYTFGQAMRFALEASAPQPITGATLFFNAPELANTYVVEVAVEPGREVAVSHEVPLTQVRLAPFTTVTYWWRVTVGEQTFTVAEQTLAYVDDRFAWQQLSQNGVTAYWTGNDLTLGQAALDVVAQARPGMEAIIPPVVLDRPLRIFIYPSTADLRAALRLTGRDWVGAHAEPELGVLLVTAVNPRTAAYDLGQSIPHELSHFLLYEAVGVGYEKVPRWFDEGLATHFEAAPAPTQERILAEAVAAQETIPFAELCATFPAGEDRALLAYAQSLSLVHYIQGQYGNQALTGLIRAFGDGADCESGVQRVLDLSLNALNRAWLDHVQPLSPLTRFLQANGLWLLLLGGGFALMGLLLLPVKRN